MEHLSRSVKVAWQPASALRTRRLLHRLFWGLLFLAFPLAVMPKEVLALIPESIITFPKNGFAEVLLPKLVVFVLLWGWARVRRISCCAVRTVCGAKTS